MNTLSLPANIVSGNPRIFIIGLLVAALYALLPVEYSSPFFIIFFGLLLGAIIILIDSPNEFNKIFFLFMAGFLIRILLALFLYFTLNFLQINDGFFIGDGQSYSLNGWRISRLWDLGIMVNKANYVIAFKSYSGAISNYDFLNAVIYYFSAGYNPIILFFINCLAGSLSIVLIYVIANKIFSAEIALLASAFCAFLPSFILWSSQNLKDPLTNLAILSYVYFLIKLRNNIKFSSILFIFLSLVCLYYLRTLAIVPLIFAFLIYFILSFKLNLETKLFFIVFMAIASFFLCKHILSHHYTLSSLLEEIDVNRRVRAYGNLAYFSGFRISSLSSLLIFLPLGFIAVWLSPFPWQVFGPSQILILPEILAWYIFLPFAIKGVSFAIKNKIKDSYFLIAVIIAFSILLGIYEGNLGTLYRHKAVVIMLAYIFISAGLLAKKKIEVI